MPDMSRIRDPEVRALAGLSATLEGDYVDPHNDPWRDSPFGWIQSRPSRQKGAIGEALVAGWAAMKGFSVNRTGNSDADRIVNGWRIEIKYSNLWTNNRIYKFQQLRDQKYDYCFCLGLSPFDAHAWFIPKSELMNDRPPALVPQHGGSDGKDTKWLSFVADSPPTWLKPFGGSLAEVRQLIESAGHGPHRGK